MIRLMRLAACLWVLHVSSLASGQATGIEFPEGKTEVRIPLLRSGSHLLAPVRINDREVGMFLVDTGASTMLIDRTLAREMGLTLVVAGASASNGMQLEMFAIDNFEVGGVRIRNGFVLASSEMGNLRSETGRREFAGILGCRVFLSDMPFSINWSRATLTLFKNKPTPPADAVKIPLRFESSRPVAQMSLDSDHSGWFLIDTGGEFAGLVDPEFLRSNSDWLRSMPWRSSRMITLGGPRDMRMVEIARAELAGFPVGSFELGYAFQSKTIVNPPAEGIIGLGILRKFELTFDYAARTAWIKPDPNNGIPAEWTARDFDPKSADLGGITPLMRAAGMKRADYVQRFLQAGSPIDALDSQKFTALHHAINGGDSAIARTLIDANAPADAATEAQATPLILAAFRGMSDIVELLLARGAKPNAEDAYGQTPLIAAADNGNRDIVQMLIKAGSDLNHVSASSGTALSIASQRGRLDAAKLLLEAGANVNLTDRRKTPLLHMAAYGGSTELVKILLDRGLDPNAKTAEGQTALFPAAVAGNTEIVTLLLDHGADPAIRDRDSRAAIDYAASQGHMECMRILYARRSQPTTAPKGGQ